MPDLALRTRVAPSSVARVPVGNEFVGLARVFIAMVKQSDLDFNKMAETQIWPPLQARFARRKKTIRPEMVKDIIRLWTKPSNPFVLSCQITDGKSLNIVETRVTGSRYRFDGWNDADWEPGVSITRLSFTTSPVVKLLVTPLAQVSLHALQRRYQRGGTLPRDRAHGRIVSDLEPLARPLAADTTEVECGSGFWCGAIIPCRDDHGRLHQLFAARTFLDGGSRSA